MAKKLDPRLLDILTRYGESAENALWDCHGTWVAYHKAIERIAAKAGIVFDMPQIIEASSGERTVAIVVRGSMGDRAEWSFGEAAPSNNKNGYPYAMAEKRAKDRVTLKLIGLHGEVYSEEEADDFKPTGNAEPPARSAASLKRSDANGDDAWSRMVKELNAELLDCTSPLQLERLKAIYRERLKQERWPPAWKAAAADIFEHKAIELEQSVLEAG